MKASVSNYSFYQYYRAGKITLPEICTKARELGFEAIEFIDMPESNPSEMAKELKKAAADNGLEVIAYTIGARMYHDEKAAWEKELDRMKGQIELAAPLGAPLMRHDVCYEISPIKRSFDLMLPQIAENTRTITEIAKTYGIKTCSENHGRIAQDSDRMERLFNAVNHENYGLLVDFGNFNGAGETPCLAVSRVAPYAFHAHAKDVLIHPDKPAFESFGASRDFHRTEATYIGAGDVDVLRCMKIMKKAGYDGYVSIEFEGAMDCIEGIKLGKENLDKYIEVVNNME